MKLNKISRLALLAATIALPAQAAEISTNTAQMQAMDKITGEVSVINVPVNTEVRFGSFSILVRACKTRPPEETPENFAFVDVVDLTNGKEKINIFKGWMMSSSPALNAVEHPVYDVWLLRCVDNEETPELPPMTAEELETRDYIQMERPQKPAQFQSAPAEYDDNPGGEPLDLIPDDIQEISAEDKAQSEVIKLESPAKAAAVSEPDEKAEDGAPQALFAPVTTAQPPVTEEGNNEQPALQAELPATEETPVAAPTPAAADLPSTPATTENAEAMQKPAAREELPVSLSAAETEEIYDDNEEIIINLENELSNAIYNN